MEVTDVKRQPMFRVTIAKYNTREQYFAMLTKAVSMEPDRIALSMTHGFLVPASDVGGVLIRLVRAWRTIHDDTEFDRTPPLQFNVEPMFENTGKVEVCVGMNAPSDLDDPLMKLIKTLLEIKK
jgi:hypothetical protein